MNNNEVAILETNLGLLIRICEAAARVETSGPAFRPPEIVALTENKGLKIRKMGRLFHLEIVDHETTVSTRPFYGDGYCN